MKISDPRHISNGRRFPTEGYADQPYVVQTDDGAWLCVVTTGPGFEGQGGQHLVSMRSLNQGRTWTDVIDIEPSSGPAASYSVLQKTPSGRIYCFYNYNKNFVVMEGDKDVARVDSLGSYVFKYSDDHGKSWSARRYDVAIREFEYDRQNPYQGKVRTFWNVGRPMVQDNTVIMPHHKVCGSKSEGTFLLSKNLLTEQDPERITFETLPDGDIGLRTPPGGGPVAEEHSIVPLSDGTLCTVYRTIDGWPTEAYSRDQGHTWTPPAYMRFSPDEKNPRSRRVKHPRAAIFTWRCSNGKYLCWFHNHGGSAAVKQPGQWPYFHGRNPAWLMAGRETQIPQGLRIEWSEPEIFLYDDDPYVGMSYPDLIEENGRFWVTETQKHIGRVHAIPPEMANDLFNQWDISQSPSDQILLQLPEQGAVMPKSVPMPKLTEFSNRDKRRQGLPGKNFRSGFTLELSFMLKSLRAGQILLDNRISSGQGLCLQTNERGTVEIVINDGKAESRWACDPERITAGKNHHIAVTIDVGPGIIMFVTDGVLNDGGDFREYGWGRLYPWFRGIYGAEQLSIATAMDGEIEHLRLYGRPLRTSEAVACFRANGA